MSTTLPGPPPKTLSRVAGAGRSQTTHVPPRKSGWDRRPGALRRGSCLGWLTASFRKTCPLLPPACRLTTHPHGTKRLVPQAILVAAQHVTEDAHRRVRHLGRAPKRQLVIQRVMDGDGATAFDRMAAAPVHPHRFLEHMGRLGEDPIDVALATQSVPTFGFRSLTVKRSSSARTTAKFSSSMKWRHESSKPSARVISSAPCVTS